MIYTVTYSCGHEGKVELFGSERGRVVWISHNKICPDCENPKPVIEETPEPEPVEEKPVKARKVKEVE